LHTDATALPGRRAAWGSWNCALDDCQDPDLPASLTYHVNRLQRLAAPAEFCVTLNGPLPPESRTLARMTYTHPILDAGAVAAQAGLSALNGTRHTFYCGAHLRYGFHEDGFASAVAVEHRLGLRW
jgi:predicted NAD/FAD-binding protein